MTPASVFENGELPHTVPHTPLTRTSIRPSWKPKPFANLMPEISNG